MIISILTTIILCLLILQYRNTMIFKYEMKAISIIGKIADRNIHMGKDWEYLFEKLHDYGNGNLMMFDISRWKFEEFFPNIEKL